MINFNAMPGNESKIPIKKGLEKHKESPDEINLPENLDEPTIDVLKLLLHGYEDRVLEKKHGAIMSALQTIDMGKPFRDLKNNYKVALLKYLLEKKSALKDCPNDILGASYYYANGSHSLAWEYAWEKVRSDVKKITG